MTWLVVLSLLSVVYEAVADYCGDNIFCHAPYKCCETKKGCCYDGMLHNNRHFRLQIWNMWYFWFLIIFMMMSCFGGCGYYRRRRLAMLARTSSASPSRPGAVLGSGHRGRRNRSDDDSMRHFNFFAYSGPVGHPPEPSSYLPPAYAEVVNQPGLYPVNKVELPPYPGNDKPENGQFVMSSNGRPMSPSSHPEGLPPPYSEYQYTCPQPRADHVAPSQPSIRHGFQSQSTQSRGGTDPQAAVVPDRASGNTV